MNHERAGSGSAAADVNFRPFVEEDIDGATCSDVGGRSSPSSGATSTAGEKAAEIM